MCHRENTINKIKKLIAHAIDNIGRCSLIAHTLLPWKSGQHTESVTISYEHHPSEDSGANKA